MRVNSGASSPGSKAARAGRQRARKIGGRNRNMDLRFHEGREGQAGWTQKEGRSEAGGVAQVEASGEEVSRARVI